MINDGYLEQIRRIIEDFENSPKYYIEWEGRRVVNGQYWISGTKKLINDIKEVIETFKEQVTI